MNWKDLTERPHLVLDFSSISILICLWKIIEHSSQSSQIFLHLSFEIVKLFSKHLYPSVVFQPWPTSSYNVLLLLPYLGACRQNQTQTNTSRASLPAYRGAYIRTDRCINKKQKYLWKHIATVPKGHLALQTRSFHYIPAFNYIIMDDRKSSSFIRVGI